MRALIAEYTRFHDPVLAPEGEAIFRVLTNSFSRCGYEVCSPERGDFAEELRRLAPRCDVGLVVAPDQILARFTAIIEQFTHNLGCGSMNIAVCANKQRTGNILASHGVRVPREVTTGKKVIKPIRGCGAEGVRVSEGPPGEGEFGQELLEGEHMSVSLIGGRITGNVCELYSGKPPLLLAINRQDIRITPDGKFQYWGGETPVDHPRSDEIVRVASRTLEVLGCQGHTGIDLVVGDEVTVVDVNPRPTTSLVGIVACMEEEIADLLVKASRGDVPDRVHLRGRVKFGKEGSVVSA
jgi:hypothetical protein